MNSACKLPSFVCFAIFLCSCSSKQEYLSCPYTTKTYYENGKVTVNSSLLSQQVHIDYSRKIIFISKYGREVGKYSFDQVGDKIYFGDNECYFYGGCSEEVDHKMKGKYDLVSKEIQENILSTWGHMQKTHLLEGKCFVINRNEFGMPGET